MSGGLEVSKMFWFFTFSTVPTLLVLIVPASGQLSTNFYANSCPSVLTTVRNGVNSALNSDGRVGASLLRLHFHDCFVQGCDGSVLLDDIPSRNLFGEKGAGPNAGSLRGFGTIDSIKASLESSCPGVVSCADILAIAARDSVVAAGGPSWTVQMGRRDGTTASLSGANNLPNPNSNAATLINQFRAQGLDATDLVALAGAHTFGKSQCFQFSGRLNPPDPTLDSGLRSTLQNTCNRGANTLVDFDQVTPGRFDSQYYTNLLANRGLLGSDQTLQTSGQTSGIVSNFANQNAFFAQFSTSMLKMGRIGVLTGSQGIIRSNCRNPS